MSQLIRHSYQLDNQPDFTRIAIIATAAICALSAFLSPVDPWPVDQWYQTSLSLAGQPGPDNYSPISAPAVQYHFTHLLASLFGLDLRGEFYLSAIVQNVMLAGSGILLFATAKSLTSSLTALFVTLGFTLFCVSMGLPQSHLSENATLLLISGWLYLAIKHYRTLFQDGTAPSWLDSVILAFLLAAAVLTRMVPVFLLISLVFLFWGRMKNGRVLAELSLALVFTALLMSLLASSNQDRFGRAELTDSFGRHMWQGITHMDRDVLMKSPLYRELAAASPESVGKPWWEVKRPDPDMTLTEMDNLLNDISKEVILTSPFDYALEGINKLIRRIGRAPYKVGFTGANKNYNPLEVDEFLPGLLTAISPQLAVVGDGFHQLTNLIYRVMRVLFPTALMVSLFSLPVLLFNGQRIVPFRNWPAFDSLSSRAKFWISLTFGSLLTLGLSLTQPGLTQKLLTFVMCGAVLGKVFWWDRKNFSTMVKKRRYDVGICLSFSLASFIGLLWVSWQVEYPNSRNIVPYLPFLGVASCIAIQTLFGSQNRSVLEGR
ncbi:MAG: hypothetical protein CL388_04080 [Acidiferrobacteraceae bacterium]|nr:hypothetical protein [Acidiferrobacteraceae bacterium]